MDDMQEMWESLTSCTPAAGQINDDGPREPPPPATPLDFPKCEPSTLSASELGASYDLVKLFSSTLRTGPTIRHLQALNVSLVNGLPLEQVVPTDFIPNPRWSEDPTANNSSESLEPALPKSVSLSNGVPAPTREDFFNRAKELLYDNEDGFRAIQRRSPLPNQHPARIVHFRKFWEGLLLMAGHWDTSLDDHFNSNDRDGKSAIDVDELRLEAAETGPKVEAEKSEDVKKSYTGRRTGTGRDMPGKYREDTVFMLVETLAWAFRCRLEQPHSQQRLQLQGTMIPILHAASVHRVPRDVRQARRGVAEGPMLGVLCREQTSFRDSNEPEGEGKQEILDLLRETGLMLMLAQKRGREGKKEEVPGAGKWWANAPRWGGRAGGEVEVTNEEITGDPTSESSRKRVRKSTRLDAWKTVQPPSSIWERGVTYQHIGKEINSEYDDVSKPERRLRIVPAPLYVALDETH